METAGRATTGRHPRMHSGRGKCWVRAGGRNGVRGIPRWGVGGSEGGGAGVRGAGRVEWRTGPEESRGPSLVRVHADQASYFSCKNAVLKEPSCVVRVAR